MNSQQQLHLFSPGNLRPERKTAVPETAKLVAPEIAKWLEQGGECSIDIDELEEQIRGVLLNSLPLLDAYKMTREFEQRHCYEPDKEFVDILDGFGLVLENVYTNLITEWIRINEIKPKFKIGENILYIKKENFKQKTLNGEIVNIDMKRGTYTIFSAELGHVKEGVGTHGVIKNFEEVEQMIPKEISAI